jgi:hypothetical protein
MLGMRTARALIGAIVIVGVAAMSLASSAAAADYTTYVGCSTSQFAVPSHVCQLGDSPGAFFESPETDTEYEVCVTFPEATTLCTEEPQEAEAGVLYVNEITSEIPGDHLVTWYVEGVEIASWIFRLDEPPLPAPPSKPSAAPIAPPVAIATPAPAPTTIGCSLSGQSAITFSAYPKRCVLYRNGRHDRAHEIRMTKLHWRDWGGPVAEASGRWTQCVRNSCSSGSLEATTRRRVSSCDHFAYTRIAVHILSPERDRTYSLHLPAC